MIFASSYQQAAFFPWGKWAADIFYLSHWISYFLAVPCNRRLTCMDCMRGGSQTFGSQDSHMLTNYPLVFTVVEIEAKKC